MQRLFRNPRSNSAADATPPMPSENRIDPEQADLQTANQALLPLLLLGLLAAVGLGWISNAMSAVLLWCVACLAVGGAVGFLFGIPKAGSQAAGKPTHSAGAEDASNGRKPRDGSDRTRPNTNLEEVSDWLTKIIVGLTLVNLGEIPDKVGEISSNAAAMLGTGTSDARFSAATALIVGFSVIGFLLGYIYTRLFLQGAFGRSDLRLRDHFEKVLAQEQANVTPPPKDMNQAAMAPSASERESAERVARAVPSGQPEAVLAPMRALAAEYAQVRREMPFGPDRTRRMAEIAQRMRQLALAARPYLSLLMQSNEPGERLAAVVCLEMAFDPQQITWLADRIHEEAAFIGYRAASLLLGRAKVAGPPERKRIKEAVEAALSKGVQAEGERDKKVEELMKELSR
jgi:hypothetical protein